MHQCINGLDFQHTVRLFFVVHICMYIRMYIQQRPFGIYARYIYKYCPTIMTLVIYVIYIAI